MGFIKKCQIKHSDNAGKSCYVVREQNKNNSMVNDLREVSVADMHEVWWLKVR